MVDDVRHLLEHLPLRIIPNLSVVDVIDGGKDYRYRFWGTNNCRRKGHEMMGKLLTQSPTEGAVKIGRRHFGWVISERRPMAVAFQSHYANEALRNQITYRFPLSSDGRSVDKIVTYQPLDIDPEKWEALFSDMWGRPDQAWRDPRRNSSRLRANVADPEIILSGHVIWRLRGYPRFHQRGRAMCDALAGFRIRLRQFGPASPVHRELLSTARHFVGHPAGRR